MLFCRIKFSKLFIAFFTVAVSISAVSDPDRIYAPQRSFTSAASSALGNSGIALLNGTGFCLNPALLYSYRSETAKVHGIIFSGYGRDSLFDRHIAQAGGSYVNGQGATGLFYRYLSGNSGKKDHEFTLNFSGQLFGNNDEQGPVDFGLSTRFEKTEWDKYDLNPLFSTIIFTDTTGKTLGPSVDSIVDSSVLSGGSVRENRLIFDFGFFQKNVAKNFDFGLVFRNLLGYHWTDENPDTVVESSILDTASDTLVVRVDRRYVREYGKANGWLKGGYRQLILGVAYHAPVTDKLELTLPLDVEILGLFDKKVNNRFSFHGGIQAKIASSYFVRFGYARAPGTIRAGAVTIPNANLFFTGAGVSINPLTIDFFIAENSFGLNGCFEY